MIIYIRHAEKEYSNSRNLSLKYRFDPAITENGIFKSKLLCQELVKNYGLPDQIYYSPFLRCRQTLECFLETFKEMNLDFSKIELKVDCEIGEYLGNQQLLNPEIDFTEETKNFNTTQHPENFKTFSSRVENHYQRIKDNNNKIWIITHGIVMNKITQIINDTRKNFNYEYLATLVI